MELYQLKECPICGAKIPVSPEAEEVSCKFCGNTFEVIHRNGKPSPSFWTGFGVATILWFVVIPIATPAVTAYLAKKGLA